MLELLAKILPLGVAMMLASPMVFPLSFYLLGSKVHPRLRTFFLFLGTAVVGVVVTIAGFFVGQVTVPDAGPTLASALIDLALGGLFAFFAIKALTAKERAARVDESQPHHFLWRAFGFGAVLELLNFDALFLVFAAAKEVSTANVAALGTVLFLVLIVAFFTAPVTIPLFLAIALPKFATSVFGRLNKFIMKYSKYIVFIIFAAFAVLLLYKGIKFFY